jgi:NhaP-type Na+/H+ or K+/H+ antiporter
VPEPHVLDVVLLAAGLVAVVVAAFLRHLQRWSITPPLLGLVTGIMLGPEVAGVLALPPGEDVRVMTTAARLLLAVALMAVALRFPVTDLRKVAGQVALFVLVVLPAMAAVVAAGAAWALPLPVGVALVLGAALSPTDPVLASGIVTGDAAERDISERDRQMLSLESGANDGLALPFLTIAIAWALGRSMPAEIGVAVYEIVAAIAVGAALGAAGGWVLRRAEAHRELGGSVRALYTLVLAAIALGLSGLLQADGLLGVFVAGLFHNRIVTGPDRRGEVELDESMNQFLVIPVFLLLGAVAPWGEWRALGGGGAVFVLVVLLLRRLPILLALRRPLGATWTTAAWLGWFGPIGVAALFYLGHAHEEGVADPRLWAAGTLVIAVSTVVHGLTAAPSRLLYRTRQDAGG